jgi:nucleoid DNA-binding protein
VSLSIRQEKQMTVDESIARVKELIQKREEIDAELAGLFGLSARAKKTARCSKCGEEGHNAKTCTAPEPHVISE